jgi:hypothetical protein
MLLNKGLEIKLLAFQYLVPHTAYPRREGHWTARCVEENPLRPLFGI